MKEVFSYNGARPKHGKRLVLYIVQMLTAPGRVMWGVGAVMYIGRVTQVTSAITVT